MPSEFLVSSSHNLLDAAREDVKIFVVIHALKLMSIFQMDHVDIASDNKTLESSDEWLL
jgi:hypothetical protein